MRPTHSPSLIELVDHSFVLELLGLLVSLELDEDMQLVCAADAIVYNTGQILQPLRSNAQAPHVKNVLLQQQTHAYSAEFCLAGYQDSWGGGEIEGAGTGADTQDTRTDAKAAGAQEGAQSGW